jgi:enamine deaminase RidA (YjgF/YER057c/UK114 family)
MAIEILNPPGLGPALGPYSQIARVKASEFLFLSGQVGGDLSGKVAEGFEEQCAQTYANIETLLKSVDAGWGNVVQFTSYLVDPADIPKYMAYRRHAYPKFFPSGVYPTHTLVVVDRLVQPGLLVEVHTVAAS